MFLKAVFPGKYIQGEGVLAQLPDWIGHFGKKGLILASPSALNKSLAPYREDLKTRGILVEPFSGECCEKELSRLADVLRRVSGWTFWSAWAGARPSTPPKSPPTARVFR